MFNRILQLSLALCVSAFAATAALAQSQLTEDVVNSTSRGIAMDGFDVVAYFTEGAPTKCELAHSHIYKGRKWLFSTAENRDLFAADPVAYEPQNNGWCAFAVANGYAAEVDFIDGWFIVSDKLYVTWSPEVRDRFLAEQDTMLTNNAANWDAVHSGLVDGTGKFVSHSQRPNLGYSHPQQLPEES